MRISDQSLGRWGVRQAACHLSRQRRGGGALAAGVASGDGYTGVYVLSDKPSTLDLQLTGPAGWTQANHVVSSGAGGGGKGPAAVDKRNQELPCPHCDRVFKQVPCRKRGPC